MIDRKKAIKELETRKSETQGILEGLYENLGESLASRIEKAEFSPDFTSVVPEGDDPRALLDEKAKFVQEILDSQASIKSIEENLSRLGKLEELISQKEKENSEAAKEAIAVYTQMGQLILEDERFEKFSGSYQIQLNDMLSRIDAQKNKIDELESQEGGFFSQIAAGVKGMVSKSQLAKDQSSLEKFYRSAGEDYFAFRERPEGSQAYEGAQFDEFPSDGEITRLVQKGQELRSLQASIKEDTLSLRNERKETADALDKSGNPVRRMSDLEKYIARAREDIKKLHRRFGSCVRAKDQIKNIAPHFTESEIALDGKICSLEELLCETDIRIEKNRIAIAIDNEKAEIDKLKKGIEERRRSIENAKTEIAGMEDKVVSAEKNIKDLQEKYGKGE